MLVTKIQEVQKYRDEHPLELTDLYCRNPTCKELTSDNWLFCREHRPNVRYNNVFVSCSDKEFDLAREETRFRECTQISHYSMPWHEIDQWLFDCPECGEVCIFHARECYRAGHELRNLTLKTGACQRTKILRTKVVFEVEQADISGKKRKREVEVERDIEKVK